MIIIIIIVIMIMMLLQVQLSISTEEGAPIEKLELKYAPSDIHFAVEKGDGGALGPASPPPLTPGAASAVAPGGVSRPGSASAAASGGGGVDTTVSVNMAGMTILLHNLQRRGEPAELLFQPRYGRCVVGVAAIVVATAVAARIARLCGKHCLRCSPLPLSSC